MSWTHVVRETRVYYSLWPEKDSHRESCIVVDLGTFEEGTVEGVDTLSSRRQQKSRSMNIEHWTTKFSQSLNKIST